MPTYTFNNFTEEKIEKGRTPYYKMTVNYSAKGEPKQKTIMSFSNPSVYNTIKGLSEGDQINVEFVKDDKYFNWATVEKASGLVAPTTESPALGASKPVARTTYETPEERAIKQVYIIKQSCLAQAVAYDKEADIEMLLNTAQQFVDWVLDAPQSEPQN